MEALAAFLAALAIPEAKSGAVVQSGVNVGESKCNVCGLLSKNRLKCSVCVNYVLCGKCLASGVHAEHVFTIGTPSCSAKITLLILEGLSEGGLQLTRIPFEQRFNRGYCTSGCTVAQNVDHTKWRGDLLRGPIPYFCPSGWYRLSLRVAPEHLQKWEKEPKQYQTLYHGLYPANVHKIIENGFRATLCQHGFEAVYLSPSIEYCSHPRYARVIVSEGGFYQFVLEVRADFRKLGNPVKKRETLNVGAAGNIDPNFPGNENLEFLVQPDAGTELVKPSQGLVVTAVMIRWCPCDPFSLPSSWWWTKWKDHLHLRRHYYVPSFLASSERVQAPPSE